MRKFLKACLIIGVICIVVGLAASAAGINAGGLTELKDQILNGEWSVDLGDWDMDLDVDPFYELEEQPYFDNEETILVDEETVKEAYSAASIRQIHVKGAGISVQFLPYDGSAPELTDGSDVVVCAVKSGKYQGFMRENTLYIIASGQSEKEIGEGVVQIMVPQRVYAAAQLDVCVEASAAAIDFGEMQAGEVEMEVSAGTIGWSALTARALEIDMAAGAVNGEKTVITDGTDVDMKAGAVTLGGVLGAEVDISVSAGKITLNLAHVMTDYNYNLSCAGGSIKLGESSMEGLAKEQKIDNQANNNMDVECSAGTVEIKFAN